jgi:DNA-directed RNA polymerase, mitochondrial
MDSFDIDILTAKRFERKQALKITSEGYGSTDAAKAITNKYIQKTYTWITEELERLKKTRSAKEKEILEAIYMVKPDVIALVIMHVGLTCVAKGFSLNRTAASLTDALSHEAFAASFRSKDEKQAQRIETFVKKRHRSLKYRRTALRSIAQKEGMLKLEWSRELKVNIGSWLMNAILASDAFVLVESTGQGVPAYVTITEEALAHSQEVVAKLLEQSTVHVPFKQKPTPWTKATTLFLVQGRQYPVDIIRTGHKVQRKVVLSEIQKAIDAGTMAPVLEAVNKVQDVAWEINPDILEMVEWAYQNDIPIPDSIPSKYDVELPLKTKVWEDMSDGERRVWRKSADTIKELNRTLNGCRTSLEMDLATAKWLGSDPFWTPISMDYRGRVYPICAFNFQRQDYVRAMFRFAEGKPLGEHGLYWLKVHLANCGDFNKVSKASFDDRVKWVDDNLESILTMADHPRSFPWWTEADSPFLFLAAAMDLAEALSFYNPANYSSKIPVSFDGSCSGLQHLCAMTRAPEGILVNLGPTAKTNDIYQVVADVTKLKLEAETDPDKQEWAQRALAFGVNRSFVKRQVMTYGYSSKPGGMRDQLKEDFMMPLHYKVLTGDIPEHPFGPQWAKAAQYLATVIYNSIEEVVKYPALAMKFLQRIASTCAHEAKGLKWTTPLGMPVILRVPKQDAMRTSLWLQDGSTKVRANVTRNRPNNEIDKAGMRNSVAPCFVHSLDACHLMMVVNAYHGPLALVHDSFGCHAGEAERFRPLLTETFVDLYDGRDVLQDILREAHAQIDTNGHRLPEAIQYGSLNIKDVLHADYAFA